jgi:hypothetical protein
VRVREFDVRRWPGGLAFLVSIVVMAGSAVWIYRLNKAGAAGVRGKTRPLSPAELLQAAESAVALLVGRVESAESPAAQIRLIVQGLGVIGQEQLAAFVEAQPRLKEQLGLAAAAEVMSRFAMAERHANRSWSAAADSHAEEAVTCLRAAERLLADTRQLLD